MSQIVINTNKAVPSPSALLTGETVALLQQSIIHRLRIKTNKQTPNSQLQNSKFKTKTKDKHKGIKAQRHKVKR